ncbi:DUF2249 domain-containing protein [Natronorubrum halalkaliphilum]|nr:DUF2249 domain-containing protein [Natronorubrum halalkaliphilum]
MNVSNTTAHSSGCTTIPTRNRGELRLGVGESIDGAYGTIDVRDLKPQRRHQGLLAIFNGLDAGNGFVLVNDHGPKPLYHQFDAEAGPWV